MLYGRPLSLPLDVRVSASVAQSSLLRFVIMVLHETVHLLVAFLSVCGIFVTSQHGNETLCLRDSPHPPMWENCETFHKTNPSPHPQGPAVLVLGSFTLSVTLAREMSHKAPEGPAPAPLQPVLVRPCYFEATSPAVWIL